MSWSIFLVAVPVTMIEKFVASPDEQAVEELLVFAEENEDCTTDLCDVAEIFLAALDDFRDPPLGDLISNSTEFDEMPLDWCQIIDAEQVAASAADYAATTDAAWLDGMQSGSVAELLKGVELDQSTLENTLDVFHRLQRLLSDAAKRGDGIISYYG